MREILFKAKRLDNGEWVTGSCVKFDEEHVFVLPIHENASTLTYSQIFSLNAVMVDPSTLCQYTGKEDKNGVKIFDGDICENNWNIYEIIYIGYLCGLYVREQKTKEIDSFDGFLANRCEVIGNIHD